MLMFRGEATQGSVLGRQQIIEESAASIRLGEISDLTWNSKKRRDKNINAYLTISSHIRIFITAASYLTQEFLQAQVYISKPSTFIISFYKPFMLNKMATPSILSFSVLRRHHIFIEHKRRVSTTSNSTLLQKFYQNNVLDRYISKDASKITLRQLVMFGRNLTEAKLISSANYVLNELHVRLAHRIRDFQHLPYICGTNPYMGKVYNMYWMSFDEFRKFPKVTNLEENFKMCEMFIKNMKAHSQVIPLLGMGISECVGLVDMKLIDNFMNRMLMTRLSRRTLVEQHIELSKSFVQNSGYINTVLPPTKAQVVGKVDTHCIISKLIYECGAKVQRIFEDKYDIMPGTSPQIIVEGDVDSMIMCVIDHIEYIIFEVLKNSVKHTIQTAIKNHGDATDDFSLLDFDPIHVTVCQSKSTITIRISDRGGGIPPAIYSQIWTYCSEYKAQYLSNFNKIKEMQAKINDNVNVSLGFGLPMSKVFANYWGGDVEVYSLPGYGVDTYIRLPRLGNVAENPAIEDSLIAIK
ncbi:hypothetical protein BB561_002963 [Smittium simulii]|uniref:Protein-serine/threonine kinase n=1 Tax=Smittium simulii TaxID=133385 RepID=A0A2T9YNK9_9FUNG|nr:hypothetical protein BB561_002963 [Smittium simulii]